MPQSEGRRVPCHVYPELGPGTDFPTRTTSVPITCTTLLVGTPANKTIFNVVVVKAIHLSSLCYMLYVTIKQFL